MNLCGFLTDTPSFIFGSKLTLYFRPKFKVCNLLIFVLLIIEFF